MTIRAAPRLEGDIPAAVLALVDDPDRFCPLMLGQAMLRVGQAAGSLVVRTPSCEVEVNASSRLLRAVFDGCDGSRTLAEVLDQAPMELRAELADFIGFLQQQGAVIDASLACAHAAAQAHQFSPLGLAGPNAVTLQLARRFPPSAAADGSSLPPGEAIVPPTPLDRFLQSRVTQYTFDDVPISPEALHALLWSAAGIVSMAHPRAGEGVPQRTIASAGAMHLLQLFVALRRRVGDHAAGVYRVRFPGERRVALEPIGADLQRLPLVFSKPWQLTYATGAVFVAADPVLGALRYRNRSLQYLFMEAGAALHNIALTAPALGLAQATIGGYYERPFAEMCHLGREIPLGACIFGPEPTADQRAALRRAPDIDFAWVRSDSPRYSMGFHLARAKVDTPDDDRPHTWGRDVDPWMAMRKAVAEAIEREGYRQPRGLIQGRMADLVDAIDPRECIRYAPSQYALSDFPFQPFEPSETCAWTTAIDLLTERPVHLLAELVYSRSGLAATGQAAARPFTQVTSSGCAAGVDIADARLRALREVIERDAFMRHWLMQRPGSVIAPTAWPGDIRDRLVAMETTGCRVSVQMLDSAWLPVAMVSVQHRAEHFTTLGLAAAQDFDAAVAGALDEVEARVYAWLHGHRPTIEQPEQVSSPEHHFELYGMKRFFRRADAVLFPSAGRIRQDWPSSPAAFGMPNLLASLKGAGLRAMAVDITPPRHAVDQGRTPLSVAKVVVPGLLPLSFGFGREPLGMVPRTRASGRFPHPFP